MMTIPEVSLPPFSNEVLGVERAPGRMDELHLYHGRQCNRSCSFCCVNGSPDGDFVQFSEEVLQAAVAIVAPRGSLKIYGGEPTLDPENLRWTVRRLREMGFLGAITIFSNGLRARPLIDLMRNDSRLFVVLNYAIFTGRGEEPLPESARSQLLAFHAENPGQLFLSHEFLVAVGRESEPSHTRSAAPLPCFRCWPTLTTKGVFHACPFAVEHPGAHYRLGDLQTSPEVVQERFRLFLNWVSDRLMPEAEQRGIDACTLCTGQTPRPLPRYANSLPLSMIA